MKKTKLSNAKIFAILKEGEAGVPIEDLCRRYGIARSTYYKLRSRYGGMELSDLEKLKSLEEENYRPQSQAKFHSKRRRFFHSRG